MHYYLGVIRWLAVLTRRILDANVWAREKLGLVNGGSSVGGCSGFSSGLGSEQGQLFEPCCVDIQVKKQACCFPGQGMC